MTRTNPDLPKADAPPAPGLGDPPVAEEAEADLDHADFDLADAAAPASVRRGAEVIRAQWKTLPMGPGVYRMLGADGEVLYVGKARSLKKRVASYTRAAGHVSRIARMIAATASMVFVSTETETEALLLEANYIKQMKPRFNVLLRDDKSFPYILLAADHPVVQLTKHRGARSRKGDYFGPFASVWAVNRTLNALQRAFLLRSCSDSYFSNRTRPCLLHQIKRCAAPCTGEISPEGYTELVRETRDFLSGRSMEVRQRLAAEMSHAAETLEFERAARLRDRIAAFSAIQGEQGINPRGIEEADVFAICEQAGQFCIEVFFFRTFQNWGNRAYYPRADRSLSQSEVLDAFLAQFYADRPSPRLILLSHPVENADLLAEVLSERAGRKVELAVPRRGEKKELVDHAAQNGRETLARRLADTASQQKLLDALAAALGLGRPLRRVEVYDNSHIMGTNAVGALIVAGAGGFMKTHYRTFNFKGAKAGDDLAMMREVLTRRFARLLKDEPRVADKVEDVADDGILPDDAMAVEPEDATDPSAFPMRPDLILIDGGAGQFEAARTALAELNVTGVAIAGIAKGPDRDAGRETFYVEGRAPFKLPPRDPALYFVQRLRDEAHRYAIGTHRAKRSKEFVQSPLDEIAGIGPTRKRALLQAFGTAKALAHAGLGDLEKVPGINVATARLVYDFFHDK